MTDPSNQSSRGAIRPIRATGQGPGLVFMPDLGGNVLYARKLFEALPPGIDCHYARLPREVMTSEQVVSVEEIARDIAGNLAEFAEKAPLQLAGASFAGYLAYEVARILAEQGRPVARIWLFDSRAHRLDNGRRLFAAAPIRETVSGLHYLRKNWRQLLGLDRRDTILRDYRLLRIDLEDHPQAYHSTLRNTYGALRIYRPAPWQGAPITLFRATREPRGRAGPRDLGWHRLAGRDIHIVDLPGDHLSILERPDALKRAAQEIAETTETLHRGVQNEQG